MDKYERRVAWGIVIVSVVVFLLVMAVTYLLLLLCNCGGMPQVHQIVDTPLPGAYEIPPTPVHDVYALDVVGRDGGQTVIIEVEVPWSTHSDAIIGWYRIPLTLILPGALP